MPSIARHFVAFGLAVSCLAVAGRSALADTCDGTPCISPGVAVFTTNTVSDVRHVHDTAATADAAAFRTEIRGRLLNGATLYDQAFAVPSFDPAIAAAIPSVETLLQANAPVPLLFTGPTLVSSAQSSSFMSSTVVDRTDMTFYVDTVDTFGPQTINITVYDLGASPNTVVYGSQTCTGVAITTPVGPSGLDGIGTPTGCTGGGPFFIRSGQLNINEFTTFVTDVFQTTTGTTTLLTTQVFDIVGIPQTVNAVPEPGSLALLAGWLLTPMAGLARRRRPHVTCRRA